MKTYETEQKYRLASPVRMRALLKRLGARKIASGTEYNELYDLEGRLRLKGGVLRLRHHGKKEGKLTLKGPRLGGKYKKRLELETKVEAGAMRAILESLGFVHTIAYRKTREEYVLGKALVTLDRLAGRGWFMEIEAAPSVIRQTEKKLGLTPDLYEDRTYLEILYGSGWRDLSRK